MNNYYYPYGYPPYPGQPPSQPYAFPSAPSFPPQIYPPPANSAYEVHPQPRDPYDANQNMIPGLGFGHPPPSFGWQPAVQTPQAYATQASAAAPAPSPQQQWPSREEPKLIPASQYYQSANPSSGTSMARSVAPSGGVPPPETRQLAKGVEDAEEGELSEGEFNDLYDPANAVMDAGSSRPTGKAFSKSTANKQVRNSNATSTWFDGSKEYKRAASPAALDMAGRERSGSYSPYLSPREMIPAIVNNRQHDTSQPTQPSNGQPSQPAMPGTATTPHIIVDDARKKAQAAILNLFPMGVRFQQYVEEGIDQTVLKNLFSELGLDISNPPVPPQLPGPPQSPRQVSKPAGIQMPSAQDQTASAAKSAGEERKDRIARLLAAKTAKSAPASASTTGSHIEAKTGLDQNKSDKEHLQQQKMDALQKSREARAQKAAVRKDSLQTPSEETSPSNTRPPSANHGATGASASQGPPASASSIPGLFLSATLPEGNNQRKRPVAADFVSNSKTNKRAFGHHRQDQPFVIDVSDASEDEDVEMEIGSPTDESTGIQQASTLSQKTGSLRDFPPLTNGRPQLSPAQSNTAIPQSGISTAPQNQGHLEVMDKQIEAMKRKIALAEAKRKLKAAMNGQASGPKSNGQTPEAVELDGTDGSKPSMRRVQSMGASSASDKPNNRSSPAIAEASSSMRLPKPSEKNIKNGSIRAEKLRAVSMSLPLVENRLQAKKSKLRLLQSQMSRLQKEIEEDVAERKKLAQEMEQLDRDSDESNEPHSQVKSKSVDPVVNQAQSRAQSEIQTPRSGVEPTITSSRDNETTASTFCSTNVSKSPPLATHNDAIPALLTVDVDAAAAGNAVTNLPETPDTADGADGAVATTPDASAGPVASVNAMEESRPANLSDAPSDIVMDESEGSSSHDEEQSQDEEQESTDAYEPPETIVHSESVKPASISPVRAGSTVSLANSDADPQEPNSRASQQIPEQISLGVNESTPEQGVDAVREASPITQSPDEDEMSTGVQFIPYESPLQYFHAYRYHPKFAETVAGGLRSLTYSNRIDPKLPVCPDQLANRDCPRGADCIYQHFETMKLPDDQILLQLGGTQFAGEEKAQYNDGLRKLLQEMRSQNIKDFPSIAQGIVNYHNRFTGDASKILPLGNVTI